MENLEDQYGFHLSEEEQRKANRRARVVEWLLKYSIMGYLLFIVFIAWWCYFSIDNPQIVQTITKWRICTIIAYVVIIGMCVYTWYQLNKSLDNNEYFTNRNANLISRLGRITESCGFFIVFFESSLLNDYLGVLLTCLPLILGSVFTLIGHMIRKGVDMQKEQELTI